MNTNEARFIAVYYTINTMSNNDLKPSRELIADYNSLASEIPADRQEELLAASKKPMSDDWDFAHDLFDLD